MLKVKFKRSLNYLMLSLSSALVFSTPAYSADNPNANPYGSNSKTTITEQANNTSNFSDAELAQMLAPIALYPDALLSHILIATTYPIEVVDAERWLKQNSQLSAQALADAAEDKDWDASVKALLPFPNVLKKLSEDLYWMRNLGDAFLQDEAQVLASIQILRKQADKAGNLEKMDNVNVVREPQTIIIEPRQVDIIYVPYYDTRVIYGDWHWSHYPPLFWHHPVQYVSHHSPYYWHNPVHLTVGLFFGAVHWNNRHVVVHHHKSRYYKRHSNKKVSTSYQAKRWQHNPHHRKGVAYRTSSIQKKYRSHTPSVQQHKAVRAKQNYFVNKNKHPSIHLSTKSQHLKYKLQANRAVKIDKHKVKKSLLNKHESHKNRQQTKDNSKTYNDRRKTDKVIKTAPVQHANKHKAVRTRQVKHNNRQSNQVFTSRKNIEKIGSKSVDSHRKVYQKNQRSPGAERVTKRSNIKVVNRQKSTASRTHQSRVKQHN